MDPQEEKAGGFGTLAQEWELLQLAYGIAVDIAQGNPVVDERLVRFRQLDEASNLMFEDWWETRPKF